MQLPCRRPRSPSPCCRPALRAPTTPRSALWIDHTGRGAVEITECNGKLCGHVAWVKDAKNCRRVRQADHRRRQIGRQRQVGQRLDLRSRCRSKYDVELTPIGRQAEGRRLRRHQVAERDLHVEARALPICRSARRRVRPPIPPAPKPAADADPGRARGARRCLRRAGQAPAPAPTPKAAEVTPKPSDAPAAEGRPTRRRRRSRRRNKEGPNAASALPASSSAMDDEDDGAASRSASAAKQELQDGRALRRHGGDLRLRQLSGRADRDFPGR